MPGPCKQFDRDQALSQALRVFWARGYEATSMQDLVEAMGVNRASLYDTFGNKRAMFLAALDHYFKEVERSLQPLREGPGSAMERIMRFMQQMVAHSDQGQHFGCFINNTAVELGPHDADVAAKVRAFWTQLELALQTALEDAIAQGEIQPRHDSSALARFINTHLQGLAVKGKAGTSEQELKTSLEILFSTVRG